MRYAVLLESRAEKELKSLPKDVLKRVDEISCKPCLLIPTPEVRYN